MQEVTDVLIEATNWCLMVEGLYSKMEIHSINNTKGDTSSIGVFTDNFTRTIYEFIQELEMAIMGWGNNQQRGNKLYNHRLATGIKAKTVDKMDDYVTLKSWLIEQYGDASRIVNDTINSLSRKKKPNPTNKKDRYNYYSDIVVSILRLERLTKEAVIDKIQLNNCLYSRSTLQLLISLLPQSDFTELKREMTRRDINYNNPFGPLMFTCFKDFCTIERNAMEGEIIEEPEILNSKPKSKNTHAANYQSCSSSEDEGMEPAGSTLIATGYVPKQNWYPPGLKFPCPLNNHKHETMVCTQFFALCPRDRWEKIERRKVCWTCMKPKDVCRGPKCIFHKKVPEVLICPGCKEVADKKEWTPLNIVFCRKPEQ